MEMAEHEIQYLGSKKKGFRWECSCGEESSRLWPTSLSRTMEAREHLEKSSQIEPPAVTTAQALGYPESPEYLKLVASTTPVPEDYRPRPALESLPDPRLGWGGRGRHPWSGVGDVG